MSSFFSTFMILYVDNLFACMAISLWSVWSFSWKASWYHIFNLCSSAVNKMLLLAIPCYHRTCFIIRSFLHSFFFWLAENISFVCLSKSSRFYVAFFNSLAILFEFSQIQISKAICLFSCSSTLFIALRLGFALLY